MNNNGFDFIEEICINQIVVDINVDQVVDVAKQPDVRGVVTFDHNVIHYQMGKSTAMPNISYQHYWLDKVIISFQAYGGEVSITLVRPEDQEEYTSSFNLEVITISDGDGNLLKKLEPADVSKSSIDFDTLLNSTLNTN